MSASLSTARMRESVVVVLSVTPDFVDYWHLTIDLGMKLLKTTIIFHLASFLNFGLIFLENMKLAMA